MAPTVSVPIYQTIYRLGTQYAAYRLIIAFSLIIIFFITLKNQPDQYIYPSIYFYSTAVFTVLAALQMMLLKLFPHGVNHQFLGFFIVDIPFLSLLFFSSVHDKFHRTLILSGFCLLKIAKISLNSSFFPKPIKR